MAYRPNRQGIEHSRRNNHHQIPHTEFVRMFVFVRNPRLSAKRRQRYVIGTGFFDWLASISRNLGSAGKFVNANKDAINNVVGVVRNVATAGASTASAVKQIVDVANAKRAAKAAGAGTKNAAAALQIPPKVLSEKSINFLKRLAGSAEVAPATSATLPDINSRIAGAGFKTLAPVRRVQKNGLFI